MNDLAISKGTTQTRLDLVLCKNLPTIHSLPLDVSLPSEKGIAHTSEMGSTRDTIY